MEEKYIIVLVTAADDDEARLIARVLLEQRKAACVNIVPGIVSLFWWQEKIDQTSESLLIIKTNQSLLDEVEALVKEIHSYENPEIIALPVVGGSSQYLDWIGKEVGE